MEMSISKSVYHLKAQGRTERPAANNDKQSDASDPDASFSFQSVRIWFSFDNPLVF